MISLLPATHHSFEHACRRCGALFSPPVDLGRHEILLATCPACGHSHGYDNRGGRLQALIARRLKSPTAQEQPTAPAAAIKPETAPALPDDRRYLPPLPANSSGSATGVFQTAPDSLAVPPKAAGKKAAGWVRFFRPRLDLRLAVLLAAGVFTLCFLVLLVAQALPASAADAQLALTQLKARQTDVVVDRNGREINRLGVAADNQASLTEFARWQLDALLFAEDREFYTHHGVSYRAIARAMLINTLRLRYAQGASTITQQLARTLLRNREKSILRKLQEIRLARALEDMLPKNKILELYVNHVYLGHGNYSFASAARFYYAKKISALSPAEFFSLLALIPSPEKYSPLRHNRLLQSRMQLLWQSMESAGIAPVGRPEFLAGMFSVAAQGERFGTETAFGEKSRTGLWPALYAREFLMQRRLLSAENQNSARVFTTIDGELQQRAEELLARHVRAARRNFRGVIKSADAGEKKMLQKIRGAAHDYGLLLDLAGLPVRNEAIGELQAALIAMNPRTGEILAMVGGESFESKNQLNRTTQMRRQTGSAIKPFIYARAVSQHLVHAATLIDDTPYVVGSGQNTWAPENINGSFEGPMPVREALARSRNIPAIRVGRLLGRQSVTELFADFFFQTEQALESRFAYDETVAIGTISLSPLEMARAFSVFANNGFLSDPLLVTRVETPEKVFDLRKTHADQLGLAPAGKDRLLSARETQLMVSLLKSAGKNAGTRVGGIIGKTGTSSESRDLWFIGGGKEIVVAVWFGYDDMRISIPGATGGALASRLAGDFLRTDFVPLGFKMQPGMVRLRVCPVSGRLASEACRHARSEVFLEGVIPEGECLHGVAEGQSEFMAVMGESQFR